MNPRVKQFISIVSVGVVSIAMMLLLVSLRTAPKRKPTVDTRPVISILEVHNQPIQLKIPVIGRLTAHEKITILAEVSGILETSGKEFLTGQSYQRGEVMLRINSAETELSLKAQRSGLLTAVAALLPELKFDYPESYKQWNAYLQSFNINTATAALPKTRNEREKFFVASKGIYNSYYQIKAQEARLKKFTIRAPFDGVLIQNTITAGNLVRIGQPLGVLVNPIVYDLKTSVSINEVGQIAIDDPADLTSENIPGSWQGRISRISRAVDEKTQMVKVFITVSDPDLRDGMFLRGQVRSSLKITGMEIPRKMLHDGNTVLEYADGTIHYHPVQVISTSGELAVISGLEDGLQLATKTLNLYEGAAVKVPGSHTADAGQSSEKQI